MIIMSVFGPALKYRLDILKYSSYDVREYVHILTDRVSYENFYQDFHNDYTFVFVEDFMSKHELSIKHEIIPNHFKDEKEHFEMLYPFFKEKNNWFSFDIHRFALPYFLSKGIKKFVIIDSDLIVSNNIDIVNEFFDTQNDKTFYGPVLGNDAHISVHRMFWDNFNFNKLPNKIHIPDNAVFHDGWIRGFNFETLEHVEIFFELWNNSYLKLLEDRNSPIVGVYKNGEGPLIWSNEWIWSNCVSIFENQFSYKFDYDIAQSPGNVFLPNKKNILFGKHHPRPEDNLFHIVPENLHCRVDENGKVIYPSRGAWYDFQFDYSGERTISSFIQKNKEQLYKYYNEYNTNGCFDVEITNTHVLTKIKNQQ